MYISDEQISKTLGQNINPSRFYGNSKGVRLLGMTAEIN